MNPAKRNHKLADCRAALNRGDAAAAERIAQALLRENQADVSALHVLGVIAASRQDYAAATARFQRCVAIDPRHATCHADLGRVHALTGRHDAALVSLERALALAPGEMRVVTDLADVLERSAQHRRARELLQPYLDAGGVGDTGDKGDTGGISDDMALVVMRVLDRAGETGQAIDMARQRLSAPNVEATTRRFLLQLLGRLLDRTGDHSAAFRAFAEAKQTESHRFSPAAYARAIDALIDAFPAEAMSRLPRGTNKSDVPIFIACMPRSGSTLVEQVIHAHPQAYGMGETTLLHNALVRLPSDIGSTLPYPACVAALGQADVDRLAADYLKAIAAAAPGATRALRITNKHLLNYLNLGMVALAFPKARVIHIRRDSMDNGLACFMTSLSTAVMPWATDLQHIGFAWRQYERLMAHWRSVLDLPILDVRYEDLVDDTEAQIRRIVDFCGLPWDDCCLDFWKADRVVLTPSYDQVRQPIFRTAMGRWRHYEQWLGPLTEALKGD